MAVALTRDLGHFVAHLRYRDIPQEALATIRTGDRFGGIAECRAYAQTELPARDRELFNPKERARWRPIVRGRAFKME